MWTLEHPLSFPSLVIVRNPVEIVHKSKRGTHRTKRMLFKLDWSGHDERIQRIHERTQTKIKTKSPEREERPYIENCPQKYTDWLNEVRFALDTSYLSEIKRMVFKAQEEWTLYRPFDTAVRDRCLRPATEFVHCAFYLLSDCLYNEDKKYWMRKRGLYGIALNIMLYKFWFNQTGGGLVGHKADMPRLHESLKDPDRLYFDTTAEEMQEIRDWLKDVDEHKATVQKQWEKYALVPEDLQEKE